MIEIFKNSKSIMYVGGEYVRNILLKGTICVLLVLLLTTPVNSVLYNETQRSVQATIYRCTLEGIEEIKTEIVVNNSNYERKISEKCRELFENDSEMQQYINKAMTINLRNPFHNITFCFINSSGKGVHMQIMIKQWLFDIIVNKLVHLFNSLGLENVADAILEIIDEFDLENKTMDIIMRSRYWSADSYTYIKPLVGNPVELNGNHKLIIVGFVGYMSYNHIIRLGFAEYYGAAFVAMWK